MIEPTGPEERRPVDEPGRIPPEERVVRPRTEETIYQEYRRPLETEPQYGVRAFELADIIRWGPIAGGLVTSLAVMGFLVVLGLAIGFSSGTPAPGTPVPGTTTDIGTAAAWWGVISALVALFLGGWVAGRSGAVASAWVGALNGTMVWASWAALLLVLAGSNLATALMSPGFPGIGTAATGTGLWLAVASFALSFFAALSGGWVGASLRPMTRRTYRP